MKIPNKIKKEKNNILKFSMIKIIVIIAWRLIILKANNNVLSIKKN